MTVHDPQYFHTNSKTIKYKRKNYVYFTSVYYFASSEEYNFYSRLIGNLYIKKSLSGIKNLF